MSHNTIKPLISTLGVALATSMALAPAAHATENPFAAAALSSGYMVADSHMPVEGKCGEGKCGGSINKDAAAATGMGEGRPMCDMKSMDTDGDGKVSTSEFNKFHEGKFSQMDANKDGALDADELGKMKEGKCGEGKCGGAKK